MKKTVSVTINVEVEVDENAFDENYMQAFRKYMYDFWTIDDHIEYIAKHAARGLDLDYIEGYTKEEHKLKARILDTNAEIIDED